MTYRLRILPSAEHDVDESARYIAQDSLEAALRFYDAVDETYRQLRLHPLRWPLYELPRPRLTELRKCSVKGFASYLIFYHVVEESVVEILRVLHGARDIPRELAND